MAFEIRCACGKLVEVTAGQAGSKIRCECGRVNLVPSLSRLRSGEVPTGPAGDPKNRDADSTESGPEGRSSLGHVILLTADTPSRSSRQAVGHFISAAERTTVAYLDQAGSHPGADLLIACALLPEGRKLIEIQVTPQGTVPEHVLVGLKRQLEALNCPAVRGGPVALALKVAAWGGAADGEASFQFPFLSCFPEQRQGYLDDLLMEAAGLAPAFKGVETAEPISDAGGTTVGTSLWGRVRQFLSWLFGNRKRESLRKYRELPDSVDVAPQDEAEETEAFLPTPGEALAEIERYTRMLAIDPRNTLAFRRRADLFLQGDNFERAVADYSEALELEPHCVRALLGRAAAYRCQGESAKALADYSEVLELEPRNVAARVNRGIIYAELGACEEALADLDAAIEVNEWEPELFLDRARIRLARGEAPRAIEDLTSALKLDPHDERIHAMRAFAWRTHPDLPAMVAEGRNPAVEDLTEAIRINPDCAEHFADRADAYLLVNDYERSLPDADRAIELDPKCALAHGIRAYVLVRKQRHEEAVAAASEAIRLGLESAEVYFSRASAYYQTGRPSLARDDCDSALNLDPRHAGVNNLLGQLLLAEERIDDAIHHFSEAIRIEPHWAAPHFFRGCAHGTLGERDRAIEDFSEAIRLEPDAPLALLNRGIAWTQNEEHERAMADFDAAIQLAPELAPAYFHRAGIHFRRAEWDKAIEDLTEVVRLDQDSAEARFWRAQAYSYQGKLDDALADCDETIRLQPSVAVAYRTRGRIWALKGHFDKAREDYNEAIRLDPGSAEATTVERLVNEAGYHHSHEDFDQAIVVATEVIELVPDCAPVYGLRAAALWYSERFVEAIDDFTKQIEISGESIEALSNRGQAYLELGDFENALVDLNRAVELAAENGVETGLPYALSGRALAHAGLGNEDDSGRDFDASIRKCPENAWVHYNHGLTYHHRGETKKAATCFRLALELDQPRLTPRKRDRAKAYVDRWGRGVSS